MEELALFVISFALGIFLRSIYTFGYTSIVFVLVLSVVCGVARVIESRRAYSLGVIFFVLLACGMLRTSLADTPLPPAFAADLKHKVSYEGVVATDPDIRATEQLVEVRVTQNGETTKILALAPLSPVVEVGELVRLSGVLQVPQPFATEGGRTFHYDAYLEMRGVRFEIFHAYLDSIAPSPWYSVSTYLARIKHIFIKGLDAVMPEPASGLAAGIAIGGKGGLGDPLKQAFILSGLIQIVVLSGYNVMVVAEGVMLLFGALKIKRKYAAALGAAAVIIFVLIAGTSSTAIRAALMAMIALYARASARNYFASRALLATIFLMLLWNPLLLVFDPGFSLSVAATAGLIWLSPLIERKLVRIKNEKWRAGVATTLAAQLAVWPLLLYDTGTLSLFAIPANILAMPIVPFAMAASAIAGLSGVLLGAHAFVLAWPAYLVTEYLITLARVVCILPYAGMSIPAFPFVFVLAAYAALGYIAFAKRSSMTDQLRLSKKAST